MKSARRGRRNRHHATQARIAAQDRQIRLLGTQLRVIAAELAALDQAVACQPIPFTVRDEDLPPGLTTAAEMQTDVEYAALDEELWGKWDQPTVAYTVAEEAAFAEQISEIADGGQ